MHSRKICPKCANGNIRFTCKNNWVKINIVLKNVFATWILSPCYLMTIMNVRSRLIYSYFIFLLSLSLSRINANINTHKKRLILDALKLISEEKKYTNKVLIIKRKQSTIWSVIYICKTRFRTPASSKIYYNSVWKLLMVSSSWLPAFNLNHKILILDAIEFLDSPFPAIH